MKRRLSTVTLLAVIGMAMFILYGYAFWLDDLRQNTIGFEWVFWAVFGLYALASWQILQETVPVTGRVMVLIFGFAVLFRAILVFSQPTLSDDMYRYVWDGRVQARQINPYSYPPDAPELAALRDTSLWPLINRKSAVTVYPAGAELSFAALWRIWPDNSHWFQAAMAFGDLMAGVLLLFLLRSLGRSPILVLIYLWNPLVVFEIAHSAHVDGWVLPFLAAAWLCRVKGRDALTGLLLGVAASLKFYPVLLLPILWRKRDESGRLRPAWAVPLAFVIGFGLAYLPYISIGQSVIGFLPAYFNEHFNFLLTAPLFYWVYSNGGQPDLVVNGFIVVVLGIIYLFCLLHPPVNAEVALRRCIWPIGAYLLLTQNCWPWYVLWLVPLLSIFLPVRRREESRAELGLRLLRSSWTGWWLFSGLVSLAYTFYIKWWPNLDATFVQFVPLYEFLLIDLGRRLKIGRLPIRIWRRAA